MAKYLGDSLVLVGQRWERDENGAWIRVDDYEGLALNPGHADIADVTKSLWAYVNALGRGPRVDITQQKSSKINGTVTWGALSGAGSGTGVDDNVRWESGAELLTQDISAAPFMEALSAKGLIDVKTWMAKKDEYLIGIAPSSITTHSGGKCHTGTWYSKTGDDTMKPVLIGDGSTSDAAIMAYVSAAVSRGTEGFQVQAPTLRRVRKIPASIAAVITPTPKPTVWATSWIISNEGPSSDIMPLLTALSSPPYTAMPGFVWGWLKRSDSRSYPGNGIVEETTEWVYAEWDGVLYTLVS